MFRPYGPYVDNLLITLYSDPTSLFNAFCGGSVDLPNLPVPSSTPSCFSSSDIRQSALVGPNNYAVLNSWLGTITRVSGPSEFWSWSGAGGGGQRGYNNFFSVMNMRPNPSCCSGLYQAGGGTPGLLRWGFGSTSDIQHLSVFQASTEQEWSVLRMVYDTLLTSNPSMPGPISQVFDWMTIDHSAVNSGPMSTITFTLRSDLKWHDGTAVTSDDVCFSILTVKDVPSASLNLKFGYTLSKTINCSEPTPTKVKLILTSPKCSPAANLDLCLRELGSIPIIPAHLWAPQCSWSSSPHDSSTEPSSFAGSNCASSAFDPMAFGIMVGSGPFVCKNINTGAVGGSCTQNADGSTGGQNIVLGGRVALARYVGGMRCCPNVSNTNLHKFMWADRIYPGGLATNDWLVSDSGTSDLDNPTSSSGLPGVGSGACFGVNSNSPFWSQCLYWDSGTNTCAPNVGTTPGIVDVVEAATVGFYLNQKLAPQSLYNVDLSTGTDPGLDPFMLSCPP